MNKREFLGTAAILPFLKLDKSNENKDVTIKLELSDEQLERVMNKILEKQYDCSLNTISVHTIKSPLADINKLYGSGIIRHPDITMIHGT